MTESKDRDDLFQLFGFRWREFERSSLGQLWQFTRRRVHRGRGGRTRSANILGARPARCEQQCAQRRAEMTPSR